LFTHLDFGFIYIPGNFLISGRIHIRGWHVLEKNIGRVLISKKELEEIVRNLGEEITKFYSGEVSDLVVVGLLRGSFIFMADLVREIRVPLVTDFMTVSSYGSGTESSGDVKIIMDLDESIEGKNVLLVEDIVDSGNTFSKVLQLLKSRKPKSLKTCSLLSKPSRRVVEVEVDFCGKEIPDEFVCGYGLDFAQKYRNLPYVGVYQSED
jgi:hypoxanthine phosphoribosyltransferase